MMPTNISWSVGILKKDDGGECKYDSITFYTTPDPDGWLLRERYPNDNDTEACPSQVDLPKKDDVCSTVYSAFIAIYKPLSRLDEGEENQRSVGFSFEKTAGCGGVIIGDSGEISYKETGRYSSLECCDVLVLYNFNPDTGLLQQSSIISQGVGNRTTTVDGPVAIVVFTSDASVVGDGFRLAFSTQVEITSPLPYTYHLEHQNQPKDVSFIGQAESNQITIFAYSPEIFHRSSNAYLIPVTQVDILSFRPQIGDDCESDTLSIYDVFRQGISSAQTYHIDNIDSYRITTTTTVTPPTDGDDDTTTTTTLAPTNGTLTGPQCNALRDDHYKPCDSILDCGDAPPLPLNNMNTTSFLAIYKRANSTGSGLRFRGFVLTSKIINKAVTS